MDLGAVCLPSKSPKNLGWTHFKFEAMLFVEKGSSRCKSPDVLKSKHVYNYRYWRGLPAVPLIRVKISAD
jgi:hypothetical protein